MKSKRQGFTLIELLVVIAIIALLMSILMPALRNVRDQAKDAMCKQRLQQWGVMFSMYAGDNDGQLMDMNLIGGVELYHGWVPLMYPYAQTFEIYLCPSAVFFWSEFENFNHPLAAWDYRFISQEIGQIWDEFEDQRYYQIGDEFAYGSYDKNVYVSSADLDPDSPRWYRNIRVKGTSQIGLLGDSNYTGAFPDIYDMPAPMRLHGPVDGDNINRWNLDRHNLSVNFVFLDWSVRKVGLKQLWQIKWSKQTVDEGGRPVSGWGNLNVVPDWNNPLDWPEWMRNSKNYDL